MTEEKFTLSHAIHNAKDIQLQGVKIGADEVTITLSRIHARKVVPQTLLETEWFEVQHGTSMAKNSSYDFHSKKFITMKVNFQINLDLPLTTTLIKHL